MKAWIPVAVVVFALLLLYNSAPRFVTWFLVLILGGLLINKWGSIQNLLK